MSLRLSPTLVSHTWLPHLSPTLVFHTCLPHLSPGNKCREGCRNVILCRKLKYNWDFLHLFGVNAGIISTNGPKNHPKMVAFYMKTMGLGLRFNAYFSLCPCLPFKQLECVGVPKNCSQQWSAMDAPGKYITFPQPRPRKLGHQHDQHSIHSPGLIN